MGMPREQIETVLRRQKEGGLLDPKVVDACLDNYVQLDDLWHSPFLR